MRNVQLIVLVCFTMIACKQKKEVNLSDEPEIFLDYSTASQLIKLPLSCVSKEYPNKLSQVISSHKDLRSPQDLHPIFYGCFDWHSAVHGYWSLVFLCKNFPDLQEVNQIERLLEGTFTPENIQKEIDYFNTPLNNNFERTYGWSWLLKLDQELNNWNTPLGNSLATVLQPLTELIVEKYIAFLPKLNYALRVGTHTNTAFGLSFAFDWAEHNNNAQLLTAIKERAIYFYENDVSCPLSWEPSGTDFLSPCLEEAALMKKVLSPVDFKAWLLGFLPQLFKSDFELEVAKVSDRKDGHLVHLDGLNFSRAWCLSELAQNIPELLHLNSIARNHFNYSYPNLIGDDYMGGHWLASFALHAFETKRNETN
ncbi:MAG: DUF2891 domain-containing protein [Lishizhenia sp.]